jgi:hypothetical protein
MLNKPLFVQEKIYTKFKIGLVPVESVGRNRRTHPIHLNQAMRKLQPPIFLHSLSSLFAMGGLTASTDVQVLPCFQHHEGQPT